MIAKRSFFGNENNVNMFIIFDFFQFSVIYLNFSKALVNYYSNKISYE